MTAKASGGDARGLFICVVGRFCHTDCTKLKIEE